MCQNHNRILQKIIIFVAFTDQSDSSSKSEQELQQSPPEQLIIIQEDCIETRLDLPISAF